jgi:hypothetical protein
VLLAKVAGRNNNSKKHREPPSKLDAAKQILGSRLKLREDVGYFLDGRPVDAFAILAAGAPKA